MMMAIATAQYVSVHKNKYFSILNMHVSAAFGVKYGKPVKLL
jgi:hypothetical protein